MKQKLFFLMLTLFVLGAASANAQVRIGGTDTPHTSAVLDLNANDVDDGDLGLALPRVSLSALDAQLNSVDPAPGTVVYNTNPTTGGTTGLYVWNGSQWVYMNNPTTASPVTTVEVVVDGDPGLDFYIESETVLTDDTIFRARPIQLKINLTPDNATADNFGWSVSGAGAKVDATGLVTANRTGTITVRATSPNGIFGDKRFVVGSPRTPGTALINGHEYATYEFNGVVWIVENLVEDDGEGGIFTTYNDGFIQDAGAGVHSPGERGYYYTLEAARRICSNGWRLPNQYEVTQLVNYIAGSSSSDDEKRYWISPELLAGRLNNAVNPATAYWQTWDQYGFWASTDISRYFRASAVTIVAASSTTPESQGSSVRCVKDEL